MSPKNILVLGSVNTDLVIRGPRLPRPGETVLGGLFYQSPGGKGANQAVAAARAAGAAGPRVTFVGAVGDDPYGNAARAGLAAERIDCRHVKVVPNQSSGIAIILVDQQGENLISVASGANAQLRADDIEALPEEVFRQAQVLLASLEVPLDAVARALERAKAAGLRTIVNPAPAVADAAAPDFLKFVDILTPNELEAALLAGQPNVGPEDLVALADRWRQQGAGDVVFTLGSGGCLVVGESTAAIAGHSVTAVDATAAGDAFNGALAVALGEGKPLPTAARWANKAAALSVTRPGAQPSLPRRYEIEEFER